jgi:NAD(P)-dependent dehydrogenase (short-subunit alcohol dehydrogenase family)
MGLLDGKVAVITGAGSGMGRASAELFAAEGAQVAALDVSGAEAQTAASIGSAAIGVHCDVSKEEEVAAAFATARERFGRIDAVLNVAGISGVPTPIHELSTAAFDHVLGVNLRGIFLGTKYGAQAILADGHGGAIVNWSSIGGNLAFPQAAAYCAAKAGAIGFTRVAALDYAQQNIRVNAICPGIASTPMTADILRVMPDLESTPPIGRAATATEVAELALFLCSDRGSYVTGAIIPIDGAWSVKIAL